MPGIAKESKNSIKIPILKYPTELDRYLGIFEPWISKLILSSIPNLIVLFP